MPYNATLCKEALGKVFVALRQLFLIAQFSWAYKNFYAVGSGGNSKLNINFTRNHKLK